MVTVSRSNKIEQLQLRPQAAKRLDYRPRTQAYSFDYSSVLELLYLSKIRSGLAAVRGVIQWDDQNPDKRREEGLAWGACIATKQMLWFLGMNSRVLAITLQPSDSLSLIPEIL
jgi:hypothetical protein